MEGVLGGTGMAGWLGAAVGVAWGWGTGQRQLRLEEGKSLAERKEEPAEVGKSLGQVEAGRLQSQAG